MKFLLITLIFLNSFDSFAAAAYEEKGPAVICSHRVVSEEGRAISEEEIDELERKAEEGAGGSLHFNLYYFYQCKDEVEKCERAMKYLKISASKFYYKALNNLAIKYLEGKDIRKDEKKAAELFMLAIEKGSIPAAYNLALMYMEGVGVDKDIREAGKLHNFLIRSEDANSLYLVALMYKKGIGVKENELTAANYYKLAAMKGHAESQYQLGLMHYSGRGGTEWSFALAEEWYLKAAKQGHSEANIELMQIQNPLWAYCSVM